MKSIQHTANKHEFDDKAKPAAVRAANLLAAKAVADAIRTSLGPRGMDKMIQEHKGDVTITNDGATILKRMKLLNPASKMMVDLAHSQDIEAGDGTTTVVVLAGNLLDSCQNLLLKGIHPTTISDSFRKAADKAQQILERTMSQPVDLSDSAQLVELARTSLSSKVASLNATQLAQIAVDAVLRVRDPATNCVNLAQDIHVFTRLGDTLDDSQLVEGLLIDRHVESDVGIKRIEKAKVGLIQFCVSPPKPDMDHNVVLDDYTQMDKFIKEERNYILKIVKQIKASGCNVLLIQKSILRDAVNDLALHFFKKCGIMVVKDVEREDVEFISRSLGAKPIASLDHFKPEMLARADLVEEVSTGERKLIRVTGIEKPAGRTVSILLRGSNKLLLEEADRSLHDALCVIRCLVKKQAMIAGGGAPEIELALQLGSYANQLGGLDQYCIRAYAQALEVIPYTLAENASLDPIKTVTELRARHAEGEKNAGISVRKGNVADLIEEGVKQPLLVTSSAISLATETVRCILKIDDVLMCVGR